MKVKPDIPDTAKGNPPDTEAKTTCRVLMCVSRLSPQETNTGTQAAIADMVRATTITVVFEAIPTHSGYRHGGIND